MVGLRAAQKQMTRKLLLDKGLELFNEQGYAATTIDDIVVAVGTTRTTFYLHFPSKGDLIRSLVESVDEMLTGPDKPPMDEVVASNNPELVRQYLDRKFTQWADIKPYIQAAHQAAAIEPAMQDTIDQWFDHAINSLEAGLNQANRFDPESRRVRCALAFGELEFLSRRWMRLGWTVDREIALRIMTDSWCQLLLEP